MVKRVLVVRLQALCSPARRVACDLLLCRCLPSCLLLQLRLDAKIPGTVLLRDKNGGVFYITIDNVQQVGRSGRTECSTAARAVAWPRHRC